MRRIQTNQNIDNTFKVKFNSNSQTFVPSLNKVNAPLKITSQNMNETFKAKFDTNSQAFASSFNKASSSFNTDLETRDQSVQDLYYDEIVYYDGGDAHGYD